MKSPSINLKKKKKTTYVDDYGISLPEAAIQRNRKGDSEAVSECSDSENHLELILQNSNQNINEQLNKLTMVENMIGDGKKKLSMKMNNGKWTKLKTHVQDGYGSPDQ